jgi:phospholipid N-methyltransferase
MRSFVFDLIATPKAVGIVTGISSALAIQVAQVAQNTQVITEWSVLAGIGTGALGWGIAWGTMRTKIAAQEVARKELKADTEKVAERLVEDNKRVAAKVEEHSESLRTEMRESAKEHRDKIDNVLREVSSLGSKFDSSIRDTRLMITEHVLNCPAIPKPRARKR